MRKVLNARQRHYTSWVPHTTVKYLKMEKGSCSVDSNANPGKNKAKNTPTLKNHLLLSQINKNTSWKACEKPTFNCGNKGKFSQDKIIAEIAKLIICVMLTIQEGKTALKQSISRSFGLIKWRDTNQPDSRVHPRALKQWKHDQISCYNKQENW